MTDHGKAMTDEGLAKIEERMEVANVDWRRAIDVSREDMPKLIAEVRRLKAELELSGIAESKVQKT